MWASTGPLALDAVGPAVVALRDAGVGVVVLDVFDWAGSLPIWFAVVAALTMLAASRSRSLGTQVFIASVAAEVASVVIKLVVGRTRPEGAELAELLISASFPSGHVTRAAVLVAVLLVLAPLGVARSAVVIVGIGAVLVMGLARVSARAHYTSDVIAAMFLGAVIVGAWAMYRQRRWTARLPLAPH